MLQSMVPVSLTRNPIDNKDDIHQRMLEEMLAYMANVHLSQAHDPNCCG